MQQTTKNRLRPASRPERRPVRHPVRRTAHRTARRQESPPQVSFGAETINAHDKTNRVRQLFAEVADSYDQMNDLMSLGLHKVWKDALVARVAPRAGEHCLDLAGGTGDIAFRLYKATNGKAIITVADLTAEMLRHGQNRSFTHGIPPHAITWQVANAEDLKCADNSFAAITLAFGLRNMTHPRQALSEAFRVLDSGGRLAVLEFSPPDTPIFSELYRRLSRRLIPALGKQIANNEAAYRYLVESIETFADAETVSQWLKAAGFRSVVSERLGGGIAALHLAWKY